VKEKVKCHATRIGLYLDGIGFNNAKEIEKHGFLLILLQTTILSFVIINLEQNKTLVSICVTNT
jgi:hypothetical protein